MKRTTHIISSDGERAMSRNPINGYYIIRDDQGFHLVGDWDFEEAMEVLEDADDFEAKTQPNVYYNKEN